MLNQQNHAAGGANGSNMVGMSVCLCLANKKPSEREFFVPGGMDLGVKLLRPIGIILYLHLPNGVAIVHESFDSTSSSKV